MLKELENLQKQKRDLVLSCSSQRLQIQEDLETLEVVSDKVESGVRLASDVAAQLRWVLPLLPLGGAFSLLGKKKKNHSDSVSQDKKSTAKQAPPKTMGKIGSILWKTLRPGGYGWVLYKALKSMR